MSSTYNASCAPECCLNAVVFEIGLDHRVLPRLFFVARPREKVEEVNREHHRVIGHVIQDLQQTFCSHAN
jgi:hypothetical protein